MAAASFPAVACPRCGRWLGSARTRSKAAVHVKDTAIEQEIARLVRDFLRNGPAVLAAGEKSVFPENVDLLLQHCFTGNVAALARFLKVNRYTIIAWKARAQRPTLLSLVDLSLKVSVSPAALLGTRLRADEFKLGAGGSGKKRKRRFSPPRKLDLGKMRLVLEESVKDGVAPRPSLGQLAKRLGCDQTTLTRRFPQLAKGVKDLHRESCAARKDVREKHLESIVRKATIEIHEAGNYPSQYRVRQALPNFIDMRDPPANKAWKQTLAELGLVNEQNDILH